MKITRKNVSFDVTENTLNKEFWSLADWEHQTYEVLDSWLKKDKVYIDVGAWIGPTVLFAAQLSKKIYTFEPDPQAWRELQENISLNGYTNIISKNVALGSSNTTLRMGSDNRLGESTTRMGNFQNGTNFSTECISIDDFLLSLGDELAEVNFIKIDIEGGEIEVAQSKILKEKKIPILLSVHPPMILDFKDKINSVIELASQYNNCELVPGGIISPEQLKNINNYYTVLLS